MKGRGPGVRGNSGKVTQEGVRLVQTFKHLASAQLKSGRTASAAF
jgi:hypothetical protein